MALTCLSWWVSFANSLQTNSIRGQVVGTLSITIHTNVYKIPPDEPKQAEEDHAITYNACSDPNDRCIPLHYLSGNCQ